MKLPRKFKTIIYKIEETGGYYADNGKWVPGTQQEVPVEAVVMPLNNEDLQYDENGTYTSLDRKIYTQEQFELGQKVRIGSDIFKINEGKDYGDYAGIWIYFAVRAGD